MAYAETFTKNENGQIVATDNNGNSMVIFRSDRDRLIDLLTEDDHITKVLDEVGVPREINGSPYSFTSRVCYLVGRFEATQQISEIRQRILEGASA